MKTQDTLKTPSVFEASSGQVLVSSLLFYQAIIASTISQMALRASTTATIEALAVATAPRCNHQECA